MEDPNREPQPRVLPEPEKEPLVQPIWGDDVLAQEGPDAIPSDVQGSYTGVPEDDLRPIQDADDL